MVFKANVCARLQSFTLLKHVSRIGIHKPIFPCLPKTLLAKPFTTFPRLERDAASALEQDDEYFDPLQVDIEANEHESASPEFSSNDPLIPWDSHKKRVDPVLLEGIKTIFKYKNMTKVQNSIISQMPVTNDLLVRSKTGTGKTLGFLVPAIQRTLERYGELNLNQKYYAKERTSVFIVSPTRELALQIAMEARRLTACTSGFKINCVYGGDKKHLQLKRLMRERNDIIVGTPGRIIDFLESEPFFKGLVEGVHTLILDEADTLLDMGFARDVEQIQSFLPKDKVTFMFSATVKPQIKKIAMGILKPGFQFVDTVGKDEIDVHEQVKQTFIVRDMAEHLQCVLSLIITEQMKKPEGKVIVFLQTTKTVELYANIFKALRRLYHNEHFQQFSMHSRLTQDRRNKTSDAFRRANVGSVLFTSDVSARGVDYPGVTKIIQVGAPATRDLYIHRVGRTGRAGKNGEAVLLLAPFEREVIRRLHGIPISEEILPDSEIALGPAERKVFDLAYKYTDPDDIHKAFNAHCGYLIPKRGVWYGQVTVDAIVSALQNWALSFGLEYPPQVSQAFLRKIGVDSPPNSRGYGRDQGFGGRPGGNRGGFPRRDTGFGDTGIFLNRGDGERGGFQRREGRFGSERSGGFQRREGGFQRRESKFSEYAGGSDEERPSRFQSREDGFDQERPSRFQSSKGGFNEERPSRFQSSKGGFDQERPSRFQSSKGGFGSHRRPNRMSQNRQRVGKQGKHTR